MKYLVMECHRSYAVVLDSKGRFLKVANMNYEVGQQVDYVIGTDEIDGNSGWRKQAAAMIAAAACLCLIILGSWQFLFVTQGTVRMQINPDVCISVNRLDYVIGLEGLNEDGENLIDGISIFGKKIDRVANELADSAVKMGVLSSGDKITLTVDSGNEKWKKTIEERLFLKLDVHLKHRVKIVISQTGEEDGKTSKPDVVPASSEIEVPVSPKDENRENSSNSDDVSKGSGRNEEENDIDSSDDSEEEDDTDSSDDSEEEDDTDSSDDNEEEGMDESADNEEENDADSSDDNEEEGMDESADNEEENDVDEADNKKENSIEGGDEEEDDTDSSDDSGEDDIDEQADSEGENDIDESADNEEEDDIDSDD